MSVNVARLLVLVYSLCAITAHAAKALPDLTALIEGVSPAVVKVSVESPATAQGMAESHPWSSHDIPAIPLSLGSGFLISDDGYVLTNYHVVREASNIQVRLLDQREFQAQLIGADTRSDLALLKIEAASLPYLRFEQKQPLKVGEWVLAIGSPFGLDYSVSAGIVSATGRSLPSASGDNYVPFVQTDVAINPGNSGGPLFNLEGRVVGVNSQILTRSGGSMGLSFAVPAPVALNVVAQLKAKGRVDRGWLGLRVQGVDQGLANAFGLKKPRGALIVEVIAGSPAEEEGLLAGDIILSFDDQPVDRAGELAPLVGATEPGQRVRMVIMRQQERLTLTAVLGLLPDEQVLAGRPPVTDVGPPNRLGIRVRSLDTALALSVPGAAGVQVVALESQGPGARAGLLEGDIIVQLAYVYVEHAQHFDALLQTLAADKPVPVRVYRDGEYLYLPITPEQ